MKRILLVFVLLLVACDLQPVIGENQLRSYEAQGIVRSGSVTSVQEHIDLVARTIYTGVSDRESYRAFVEEVSESLVVEEPSFNDVQQFLVHVDWKFRVCGANVLIKDNVLRFTQEEILLLSRIGSEDIYRAQLHACLKEVPEITLDALAKASPGGASQAQAAL